MSAPELATALRCDQSGDLRTAGILCNRILEAEPQNAAALHLLGAVELQSGHHERAVKRFVQAVSLDSSHATYLG